MRKIALILVICFVFSAVSTVARADNNPVEQFFNGLAAIITSPYQLYKVPKENVEKHGWSSLPLSIPKAVIKGCGEIGYGGADMAMPLGKPLSEGCAFSNKE